MIHLKDEMKNVSHWENANQNHIQMRGDIY